MEAERRSTMSSLKGQLSNVEGSVKSMKVAVVVGSVLTVACLAAVFGVTVLANEVSKEVKVSNGALASKSGEMVQTATIRATEDMTPTQTDETLSLKLGDVESFNAKIQASVTTADSFVYIIDGGFVSFDKETGASSLSISKGSMLESALSADIESRKPQAIMAALIGCGINPACLSVVIAGAKFLGWMALAYLSSLGVNYVGRQIEKMME